jgi:hypothetical protein
LFEPEVKSNRNWFDVGKANKKAMDMVDMSIDKDSTIDINKQKEIYLGGDDD